MEKKKKKENDRKQVPSKTSFNPMPFICGLRTLSGAANQSCEIMWRGTASQV